MSDSIRIDPAPTDSSSCPLLTRRGFLKGMAAGATALAASAAAAPALQASSGVADEDAVGMLIDLTRCTGCNSCTLACKAANDLANPKAIPTQLDSDAYSFIDERTVSDEHGNDFSVFVKRQCMHCVHPACASACTVGALRKTAAGPVVYDSAKCIGCRYCQYACPFGLPAYEWENPLGLIGKCELCVERLAEGEKPACVSSCPNGAIRFGKRSVLLAQAHAQIASNPGRYIDAVYGEHEVGGTSMLYLAPVPFSALGFPTVQTDAIPRHAEWVMTKTPIVAATVAALAVALQAITRRRGLHGEVEFAPQAQSQAQSQPSAHQPSMRSQGGAS